MFSVVPLTSIVAEPPPVLFKIILPSLTLTLSRVLDIIILYYIILYYIMSTEVYACTYWPNGIDPALSGETGGVTGTYAVTGPYGPTGSTGTVLYTYLTQKEAEDCITTIKTTKAERNVLSSLGVTGYVLDKTQYYRPLKQIYAVSSESIQTEFDSLNLYTITKRTLM